MILSCIIKKLLFIVKFLYQKGGHQLSLPYINTLHVCLHQRFHQLWVDLLGGQKILLLTKASFGLMDAVIMSYQCDVFSLQFR